MSQDRVIISWSGGKDSALALQKLQAEGKYQIAGFITTCTEGFRRISMHGVRCSMLNRQCRAIGIPVQKVFIPKNCDNSTYESIMRDALASWKAKGVNTVAFGDLFLTEIRDYRNRLVSSMGMKAIYPIWGRDTAEMAKQFLSLGFQATIVCADKRKLSIDSAGKRYDASFLESLPESVDPCGENGEFHTFVHDGPIFNEPLKCKKASVIHRDHWYYADLKPLTP